MEEQLSQKIQEVLNDPAQMAQVLELAKSLGVTLPPPDAPAGSPPEEKAPPDVPPAPPPVQSPPMRSGRRRCCARLSRFYARRGAKRSNARSRSRA